MKNFFSQGISTVAGAQAISESECGKLYVAYLNEALITGSGTAAIEYENNNLHGKPSILSTTGGSYYINGMPAILSQDEEAMLYENEYSEYY